MTTYESIFDKSFIAVIILIMVILSLTFDTITARRYEIKEEEYLECIIKLQDTITLLESQKKTLEQEVEYLKLELQEAQKEEIEEIPEEIKQEEVEEKGTGSVSVPKVSNNKTYMDYRAITSTNSPQYKLQHGGKTYTDDLGLRKVGDMYCVALGTYYCRAIGDKFLIGMENGNTFKVIAGDVKADQHTDRSNRVAKDGSVIEFIVDTKVLHATAKKMGDISYASPIFKGNIEYIKPLP